MAAFALESRKVLQAQDRANIAELLSDDSLTELLDDLLDTLGGEKTITVVSISMITVVSVDTVV